MNFDSLFPFASPEKPLAPSSVVGFFRSFQVATFGIKSLPEIGEKG